MYKGTAVVKNMLQEMTLVWDQYDSWMFLQEVFYNSQRMHLFDQKYEFVKYYYNLKCCNVL